MYYINTPYGVLLIDIKNDGNITSVVYDNNQLTFTESTTLQLVVTHDPACSSLAILLASFLCNYYQSDDLDNLFSHGDNSSLEESFISFSNNYDYEMMTETYNQNDSISCTQPSILALNSDPNSPFPCMFNCPNRFNSPNTRIEHYRNKHQLQYQSVKTKYSRMIRCPLCGYLIFSFLSFSRHINKDHRGKSYAYF